MGNYVNNGKINLGERYNLSEAIKEIAGLLNVNPRSDGRYYLSDICMAENVNWQAKYRPIPHTTLANLSDGERVGARYGLDCNVTADENEYTMYIVDIFAKSMTGQISRIRDFHRYNHNARYGLEYVDVDGSTTLSYSKLTNAKIIGYNANQDNIGLDEVKNLLAYWLSHGGIDSEVRSLNEWGVILYCTTGYIMLDQNKGAYDTLTDADTAIQIMQTNINEVFKTNVPKNKEAYVGVFFTDQYDFKYVVNPTKIFYKSITDGYVVDVSRFASHMYVRTSGNVGGEIANWREAALDVYGATANGSNYDQISFACHLENLGHNIDLSLLRLKMTFTRGPAAIKGKTVYHSLTFPNFSGAEINHGQAIGTDQYKGTNTQKSDYAFYISSEPILTQYGSAINGYSLPVTIQLVMIKRWAIGMPYRILTSPITINLRFNTGTCTYTPLFPYEQQNIDITTHEQED